MKFTDILYGALLVYTTLATPVANNAQICWLPGELCTKASRSLEELSSAYMKRAAEAQNRFCWLPGEHCAKEATAKRDESPKANNSTITDEEAVRQYCNRSGQPCSKLKRVANAVTKAMALPETLPEPQDVNGTANRYCYGSGQPCAVARRSALALAQGLPLDSSTPFEEATAHHHWCYLVGQSCGDYKRDPMARRSALPEASTPFEEATAHHHWCYLVGQSCGDYKRDALAAAEALADIEYEFTKREVGYDVAAAQEYCDSEAGPCTQLKRFATDIVDAISEPAVAARTLDSEDHQVARERCYAAGGACDLSKRMVERLEKMTTGF